MEEQKCLETHLHDIHFEHGTPKFWHAANSFGHGPLDLHDKICSRFFNVDFWNGTPETRTALLNLWVPALIWQRFTCDFKRASGMSGALSRAVKKRGKYGRFSSGKSNCMPLCFEKAKTSVTIEGRNKVIPCTVLTYIKATTIRPAACYCGLYNKRQGNSLIITP